jgi:hypothetical protein
MSKTSSANPNTHAADGGDDDSLWALQAVQVALDRRDNGGHADVARDQETHPAASIHGRFAAARDRRWPAR